MLWNNTGTDETSTLQLLSAAHESTVNTGILAPAATIPGASGLMALMTLGGGAIRRRGRTG